MGRSLTKGKRFEIFKRDGFTCQYCGRKPPEVVLHVDHVMPVAEGGDNDEMNLVTACSDCNLGKSKKRIEMSQRPDADLAWLEMQQEIAELERYQQAKQRRDALLVQIVERLQDTWVAWSGMDWHPSNAVIMQMLLKYSPEEIEYAITVTAPKVAVGYVSSSDAHWLKYLHGVLKNNAKDGTE